MMLLLKKIIICFLICSVQVIEAPRISAKSKSSHNANNIRNFFENVCWQNLNDVNTVKYLRNNHKIEEILLSPINRDNYTRRIRIATLFLGCSYANDLQYIFFMLGNLCAYCYSIADPKEMYDCSIEIINNTLAIIPMIKKMKGAMDTIENYHIQPWVKNLSTRYILSFVFESYGSIKESLKNLQPSRDDPEITKSTLEYINKYFHKHFKIVEVEIDRFCVIEHMKLHLLWYKYQKKASEYPNKEFHHYVNEEVRNKIYNTSINKFFKLGFLYNIQTEMVSIPLQFILPDDNKEINLNNPTTDTSTKIPLIKKEGYTSYANLNEDHLKSILHNEELRYISPNLTTPIDNQEENQINYETGETSQRNINDLNDKPFYTFI
ncbi:uncharacterized protein LOC126902415 isoform X2 [Daktulosphaira vitifoliae]|uniref:uncharacterized protein LOC126902415 isoform X2 n=1 Tax=Daktulosphaira vitifoliae TaxID=58002 RepID=UPI0021A9B20F|nr:uncharacterized protein LOC126902415 isoform X2 [Daktulosphaira vitifoliae]XP_050535622.1 uncharacterized protein LOC126902415 isoform X2 [Daktulosphaira vitifoliae]